MAKKEQKKPSKKTQTKGAVKAKKAGAKAKKAAAPAKKTPKPAAKPKKASAPVKKAAPPVKKIAAEKETAESKAKKTTKSYSIAEFADMTYLTENGVRMWLKQGLLKGQQDAGGEWQIDASNLDVPNVKRLVR